MLRPLGLSAAGSCIPKVGDPEALFVFVSGPAVFVAAHLSNGPKLLIELLALFGRWSYYGVARIDFYQLAITMDGTRRRHRDMPAGWTRQYLRRFQEGAPRAFLRKRFGRFPLWRQPLTAIVKLIMVNIGNESEPDMIVRMIEN